MAIPFDFANTDSGVQNRPRGSEIVFMLYSTEHELFLAHK